MFDIITTTKTPCRFDRHHLVSMFLFSFDSPTIKVCALKLYLKYEILKVIVYFNILMMYLSFLTDEFAGQHSETLTRVFRFIGLISYN